MKSKLGLGLIAFVLFVASAFNLLPEQAEAKTSKVPVVFVHGLTGADTNFNSMKNYLIGEGWSGDELYAIDLPSKSGHQELNSTAIAEFVDEVRALTGHSKVNIVAHSMGGANSLYYILNKGGSTKVNKLITLGGANAATTSFAPWGIDTTSIYSANDTIVANNWSYLFGANNILVYGVSHVGFLNHWYVNWLVKTELSS